MTEDTDVKKNRAALYCRVSTEDQAKEGFSLAAQQERLEAYCVARGWKVEKLYIDDGYSGRYDVRPAYSNMMAEKDEWDILVVLKMDRIHRNSKNFTLMMEKLKEWDKEFTSMQENFDTTTAMGRFVMDIIQRIAQLESEQIGERVYIGMSQKAKEGKGILGFNIPYGFDHKDGKFILNEAEATEIRHMFMMCMNGSTLREICKDLERREVSTKKGSTKWDPKTVQRILSNPIYCGFLKWDGISYTSSLPAIIDIITFNQVQEHVHKRPMDYIVSEDKKPMETSA